MSPKKIKPPLMDEASLYLLEKSANLNRCVLCGKCAAVCPSFKSLKSEVCSPRGRMALLQAYRSGNLDPGEKFTASILNCLACGACESVCPTRARPRLAGLLMRSAPPLARHLAHLQKSLKAFGLKIPPATESFSRSLCQSSAHQKESVKNVVFFPGCLSDTLMPESVRAAWSLVQRFGYNPALPDGVICCGLPHLFAGLLAEFRQIALKNIKAFEKARPKTILCGCPSCAAMFKSYPDFFDKNSKEGRAAQRLASRIMVFSDWLEDVLPSRDSLPSFGNMKVIYDEPCSLKYGVCATKSPRRILKSLPDVQIKKWVQDDCAPGLTLLLSGRGDHPAKQIQSAKLAHLKEDDVDAIVAEDSFSRAWWLNQLRKCPSIKTKVYSLAELIISRF